MIETYILDLSRRLAAGGGHRVHFVTAKAAPELLTALPGQIHVVRRLDGPPALRMWHFARSSAECVRVLHPNVSIGFGRTWQQDIHRNMTGCHPLYERLLPWWQRWSFSHLLEGYLERKLHTAGGTALFVAGSGRVARQLQTAYHQPPEAFRVLFEPSDTTLFRPSPDRAALRETLCRDLRTDSRRPVLLFVSLSHRRKGLDALLAALTQVDATLWIAGKPLGAAHQQAVARLGLHDRVRVVPVTANLLMLYQTADWFVHPTLYDAGAAPVLQAMASGLPGVISTMDGHADHIRNGGNGFVLDDPSDADALAAQLNEALATGEAKRERMGAEARATAEELTWQRHEAEWESVLEECGAAS